MRVSIFAVALAPAARPSFPTASGGFCREGPVDSNLHPLTYRLGVGDCGGFDSCRGPTLLVGSSGECHADVGPGCDGLTGIVASRSSCEGAPEQPGCRGKQVITPLSDGRRRGGGGESPRVA